MTFHPSYCYPGAAAVALFLAACATFAPPTEQLAAAKAAIDSADLAGAARVAPQKLSQAREKLSTAQIAATANDSERARRLADQALVDAQLAQPKTSTAQSREELNQAEGALRALREETNRPAQPAAPDQIAPVSPTQ